MKLRVIKPFNGKAEGKTLCPGEFIQSNDVERINALVGRGFCVIVALDDAPTASETAPTIPVEVVSDHVEFQGKRYHIETIKAALGIMGIRVAHNAKEKAVSNALSALNDEQEQTLSEMLNNNETADPNPEKE
jgi:hypothetical protein